MLAQAEENWAVNYIKETLSRCDNCRVELGLLSSEEIYIPQLKALCTSEFWYIDPLSDGYRAFIIHKDYLRQDSCTRKICGYTAQEAVEEKINIRREPVYKPCPIVPKLDMRPSIMDLPEIRTYRIQWLSRPLHRIHDAKQEYIPIWNLCT